MQCTADCLCTVETKLGARSHPNEAHAKLCCTHCTHRYLWSAARVWVLGYASGAVGKLEAVMAVQLVGLLGILVACVVGGRPVWLRIPFLAIPIFSPFSCTPLSCNWSAVGAPFLPLPLLS